MLLAFILFGSTDNKNAQRYLYAVAFFRLKYVYLKIMQVLVWI